MKLLTSLAKSALWESKGKAAREIIINGNVNFNRLFRRFFQNLQEYRCKNGVKNQQF
jgi:hypothetical protein